MADRAIKGDEFPEERNSVTNCWGNYCINPITIAVDKP
jgi:hypothetical protein